MNTLKRLLPLFFTIVIALLAFPLRAALKEEDLLRQRIELLQRQVGFLAQELDGGPEQLEDRLMRVEDAIKDVRKYLKQRKKRGFTKGPNPTPYELQELLHGLPGRLSGVAKGYVVHRFDTSWSTPMLKITDDPKIIEDLSQDVDVQVITLEPKMQRTNQLIVGLMISNDDQLIVVTGRRQDTRVDEAYIYDSAHGDFKEISFQGDPKDAPLFGRAAITPDNRFIIAGLNVFDAHTGKRSGQPFPGKMPNRVLALSLSIDGSLVAMGINHGVEGNTSVEAFDFARATRISATNTGGRLTSSSQCLSISRDNSFVVAPGGSDSVHNACLIDVKSGQIRTVFEGHTKTVLGATLSPDDTYMVTSSLDKTVRVWDVNTAEQIRKLEGHTDSVYSVAISSSGKYIVGGSNDANVYIWDAYTGNLLNKLGDNSIGHTKGIGAVEISHDDSFIVTGADDGTAKIWRLLHPARQEKKALSLPNKKRAPLKLVDDDSGEGGGMEVVDEESR